MPRGGAPSSLRPHQSVVVMGKRPVAGRVKTRLGLPGSVAADVYRAMLWDTCAQVETALVGTQSPRIFAGALDRGDTLEDFRGLVPDGFRLVPQQGVDLGDRMRAAWGASPAEMTLVMGSDLPTLPPDRITAAFRALEDNDAVFMPTDDGGYGLFGLRRDCPALFRGMSWSTAEVMAQTVEVAAREGLCVELLAPHHDVDTLDDLFRMWPDLPPESQTAVACRRHAQCLWGYRDRVPSRST